MPRIKNRIALMLLLLAVVSCIRPFDPLIEAGEENKYVVSGCITDEEGAQTVFVSVSAPMESPEYLPLGGCTVTVTDDRGNSFSFQETETGRYSAWIGKELLSPGTVYQLRVSTPSGALITSVPDTMPACPPIDSLYFIVEDHPTPVASVSIRGLQFYTDLDAEGFSSHYYKWEMEETWEFHAAHAKEWYFDGNFHQIDPPDSSTFYCWFYSRVKNIFTLSTKNLARNEYQRFPLHFVDGSTNRLSVLYSILVRQMAISEAAYLYWDQLRINSNDQGGLYEKQPLAVKGNLEDANGSGKEVLGFFHAASVKSIRIFLVNPGMDLTYTDYCNEYTLGHFGWDEFLPKEFPVYFYFPKTGGLLILNKECVECEMLGGVTVKPDYWPR